MPIKPSLKTLVWIIKIFKQRTVDHLTAIDWLRQEELQEVPPKNGYFQIDGWI